MEVFPPFALPVWAAFALPLALVAAIAGLSGWLWRGREMRLLTRALARAETRLHDMEELDAEVRTLREAKAALEARLAAEAATLSERQAAFDRQLAEITALKKEMAREFEAMALAALKANQTHFLTLANETFAKHKHAADADLAKRQEAIQGLLRPMEESLKRYEKNLSEIEKARAQTYGALSQELKQVAAAQMQVKEEAGRLVNALRAAPKTRGRWGEHQLANIMELSGMSAHVDFVTQVAMAGEEGRLVPDAVIRLPGGRAIVVDAKTSMAAYLDAVEAPDDKAREQHLVRHARQIREHMKQLGSKRYWDALDIAPDFVAMFIPGENFFAAAIERDPELFEDGAANRVLMVTPTTMIALAKAIAYGWRQERMADNARKVAELGRDLYRRLAAMGEHVGAMGRGLDAAVRKYNEMVGSLERSVLPQARKFQELDVEGTSDALTALEPIESEAREPGGRDLKVPPANDRK
ncbi:MAG: DNA recombination protein RmuC [Pseudomonadota bacterium]